MKFLTKIEGGIDNIVNEIGSWDDPGEEYEISINDDWKVMISPGQKNRSKSKQTLYVSEMFPHGKKSYLQRLFDDGIDVVEYDNDYDAIYLTLTPKQCKYLLSMLENDGVNIRN